jgi:hypothetical protein
MIGFEAKITELQIQARKLIFLKNSLLAELGTLAASSLKKDIGVRQKTIISDILKNYPEIVELVGSKIQDTSSQEDAASAQKEEKTCNSDSADWGNNEGKELSELQYPPAYVSLDASEVKKFFEKRRRFPIEKAKNRSAHRGEMEIHRANDERRRHITP